MNLAEIKQTPGYDIFKEWIEELKAEIKKKDERIKYLEGLIVEYTDKMQKQLA